MITRRFFVAIVGGAALMSRVSWAAEEIPSMLDHILLGCSDLDQGIAFVEQYTGVRAGIGGVHPGRGTRNALLSLGERRYLEIIAPDPGQSGVTSSRLSVLKKLSSPRLVGWAAHVSDIEAVAKKLRESGVKFEGPSPGSRRRPDGRVLTWKTLDLDDDCDGLLPFFIEWRAESVHPSVDATAGCRLERFVVEGPETAELSKMFKPLGIDVPVERADKTGLRARMVGVKGTVEVQSS
jgi:hypothetical protein